MGMGVRHRQQPGFARDSYAINALLSRDTDVTGLHAGLSSSEVGAASATFLFLEEAAPNAADSTNDGYFDPRNDHTTSMRPDSPFRNGVEGYPLGSEWNTRFH